MLYRYLNILFYSFILQKVCVCVSVCVRKEVIEWVLGREGVSVKLLTCLSCVELQTLEIAKSPFCCRCSPPCFSQSKWRSQVRSKKKKKNTKRKCVVSKIWTVLNVSNLQLHLWFPLKHWKVSETSSSQCLLGKSNKKKGGGGAVVQWVKGMKVWLTGEIKQSVSPCRAQTTCSLSAVWHKLTTPQHISLHSQQTDNKRDEFSLSSLWSG